MTNGKDDFKYWHARKWLSIVAIIISAFCADSFNASLIAIWIIGVALPIVVLFLTSNDGDEFDVLARRVPFIGRILGVDND
jgi:hypothetical protein